MNAILKMDMETIWTTAQLVQQSLIMEKVSYWQWWWESNDQGFRCILPGTERYLCTKHIKDNLDHFVATELNVGKGFNIGSDDEKAMTKALDV